MKYDTIVLGAGMVGISTALHLQRRGQAVALLDRRGPAEETSFGNAGIIQTEAVMPYPFPRDLKTILAHAFNRRTESHLHWRDLPVLTPWLYQYWRHGTPERVMRSAFAAEPLIDACLAAHRAWIEEAGATHLLRETGYLKVFRDADQLEAATAASQRTLERFEITYKPLDPAGITELEPHLAGDFAGGILVDQPASVSDPNALARAYVGLFTAAGGTFLTGDAQTLAATPSGWQVEAGDGPVTAANAVVALGPWSGQLLREIARAKVPLVGKRGYHMHYAAKGNAGLARPVLDTDYGYVITPMAAGIRLTTGAEFARLDAPPTPVQLERVEPIARQLFPLAERVEAQPWLGSRPCTPDMIPVIGAVPGQKGLWANFGHHHLGVTLGPISGQLLAEMMTGAAPFTDPAPYRVDRF